MQHEASNEINYEIWIIIFFNAASEHKSHKRSADELENVCFQKLGDDFVASQVSVFVGFLLNSTFELFIYLFILPGIEFG